MKKILFFTLIFGLPSLVFAASVASVSVSPNLPGMENVSITGPCAWIVGFYNFALIAAGILAFGAAVYGGFKYATSAGNPSRQSEGRSWITSALLGILLLAGAYIILYTINPNLTKCSLPVLSGVAVSPTGGAPAVLATGCAGGQCQALPNCTANPGTGAGHINCGGAPGMVGTLNCVQQADPNFKITEGYPPAVPHSDACHNTGCCVDAQIADGLNCSSVQQLISAAQQCGAVVLNEYASCGGKTYGTTTGNNVHIDAKKGSGGC